MNRIPGAVLTVSDRASAGAYADRSGPLAVSLLAAHGIDRRAVKCAASIDLKAEEAGLLAYCRSEGLSAEFYTADELRAVRGEFTPSEFVKSITGVDNVCERAALRNAETLLVKKTARSGVTVAAAAEHWEVRFA